MLEYNISIIKTKLGNFFLKTQKKEIIYFRPFKGKASSGINSFHIDIKNHINLYILKKKEILDFKCNPPGSCFQKKVWNEVKKIRYGRKKSYKDIAKILKTSPRAVGNACSTNPCLFFIPCHRVISNSGGLGGYVLGNNTKKELLSNESRKNIF